MPSELVVELHLKIGQSLTAEQQNDIEQQISEEAAFGAATNLLSYRDRSTSELERRLLDKGFGDNVVKQTVNRMLEYGYLDDERFAKDLAQVQIERGKGRRAAQSALYKAGLPQELIEQAIDSVYNNEQSETEAAVLWLSRKPLPQTPADRQRLLRNLAGRGFGFDIAKEAIRQWEAEQIDAEGD